MTNRRHAHHSQEARDRLASYAIDRRKIQLDISQEELAERGGPSTTTSHYIESGDWGGRHDFTGKTKREYEDAVRWVRGSINAILAGGEPRLLDAGRIGDQLIQRRVSLGVQHRDEWCAQKRLDAQLVHDAEQGLLYHFTEWQIAHLEKGYGLVRGTIRMNLAGQATGLAVASGSGPSGAASILAARITQDAALFEDLILKEMAVNEQEGRGNLPNWQSDEERANWNALANARRPVHVLVANAVWWRITRESQNTLVTPPQVYRNTA